MGKGLGALLTLDPAVLSRDEALDHLESLAMLQSRVAARMERTLAALHDPADPKTFVREEVACALRWSFGYAEARLHQASALVTRLPRILELEERGLIGEAHVRAATEMTDQLDPAVLGEVEQRVLARAPGQTPTQFKASVRRAVASVDSRSAQQRHADAVRREKTVRFTALPDGMAGIWSVHDAVTAAAMYARIGELANRASADDTRLVDERRADMVAAMVLGTHSDGSVRTRPLVQILIPSATVAATSEAPAELIGYGPIPASLCRAVLDTARVLIETIRVSAAGTVLAPPGVDDRPWFRFPSATLARHLRAAWPTCRFPGCNRRAIGCELDHHDRYNGFNTVQANLGPLCARHHHLKHEAGWTVYRDADGVSVWTSPTGRVFRKPPDELPTADP